MINTRKLKSFNSFAIDTLAGNIIVVHTEAELFRFWQKAIKDAMPVLILGGGSNILFLDHYAGTVLLNRIPGLIIEEFPDAWYLHVGAGEVWNKLVHTCLEYHIPGLENLALIPGYVGSAPIQNIGAYGVELKQFFNYADVLRLTTGKIKRFNITECKFGYRDSIFKHELCKDHAIIAVGLRLTKAWKPVLTYSNLIDLDSKSVTPKQIYDIVCKIRREKLPDPLVQGNAGSFFKNPIIDILKIKYLLNYYPEIPYSLQSNGDIKLSAGWLIDHCGLKGYRLGGAAVHEKQASVLINTGNATGKDIAALARYVRQRVAERFLIWLEPEVRFIDINGEVDAVKVIS